METLESSRVCRLCGKQSGISINIFDKNENHVKKINAVLPIMVHEMDLLPKHMCHRCSYKLEEFHKFYVDCLKTDEGLKSQLSWMSTEAPKERVGIPMVHIENAKIKIEPIDYDAYNTIDDNVNYINSMSSVTFPPNEVPYASYARCRCCCDKMDQSNQTVSANYETIASKRDRLEKLEANVSGRADGMLAVKKDVVTSKTSSVPARDKKNNKEPRNNRSTSSNCDYVDEARAAFASKETLRGTVVRNLRPRRGSVNYGGTKKKVSNSPIKSDKSTVPTHRSIFDTTWIKTEKVDDYKGRTLRPRKRTINYWGTKRKYTKSLDKKWRPQDEESPQLKVRNIANQLELPTVKNRNLSKGRIKLAVKEEQISDTEDNVFDESKTFLAQTKNRNQFSNRPNKMTALHKDFLRIRDSRVNYSVLNSTQVDSKIGIFDELKSLKSVGLDKIKSKKNDTNLISPASFSSKHSRNVDRIIRGGKVKKLGVTKTSTKKSQKTLRNITNRGKSTKSGMMTISDIVGKQKISALIKLNGNNIKHYCEGCNMRFFNKELFKLHACYR